MPAVVASILAKKTDEIYESPRHNSQALALHLATTTELPNIQNYNHGSHAWWSASKPARLCPDYPSGGAGDIENILAQDRDEGEKCGLIFDCNEKLCYWSFGTGVNPGSSRTDERNRRYFVNVISFSSVRYGA
jgi:hypothetical protein